jgi:hypothetical protein
MKTSLKIVYSSSVNFKIFKGNFGCNFGWLYVGWL